MHCKLALTDAEVHAGVYATGVVDLSVKVFAVAAHVPQLLFKYDFCADIYAAVTFKTRLREDIIST